MQIQIQSLNNAETTSKKAYSILGFRNYSCDVAETTTRCKQTVCLTYEADFLTRKARHGKDIVVRLNWHQSSRLRCKTSIWINSELAQHAFVMKKTYY